MKILNFGSLNIDYVYRVHDFVQRGETIASMGRMVACGGKGLNQSVALARSGAKVWHAGCVGSGDGGMLLDALRAAGVNVDFVRGVDGPSGHTVIQVSDDGDNAILLFQGANHRVDEAMADEVLGHFGAGDLLVLQNEISNIPAIMRSAKARGMKIAMNPSPVAGTEAYPMELCDWLFVNRREAAQIAGCDYEEGEEKLSARFPQTRVVVTRGEEGAAAVGAGQPRRFVPAVKANAVDTTGAGDTFLGFCLGRMAMGDGEGRAMELAARASAIAVGRKGAAQSIPALEEVLQNS